MNIRAKAENDAWTAVGNFRNTHQGSVTRELEQQQKAKGKQFADPVGDLKTSDLPVQFHDTAC